MVSPTERHVIRDDLWLPAADGQHDHLAVSGARVRLQGGQLHLTIDETLEFRLRRL